MILTGPAITKAVEQGDVLIDPFDQRQVNPNSYNFRLGDTLLEPTADTLEVASSVHWRRVLIPATGLVLKPRTLYLGSTRERFGSRKYVMTLLGRSSIGRLGIFLNVTADLGHIGSESRWTLEIRVVQKVRIYPGMKIGQMAFWVAEGNGFEYRGRYYDDDVPEPLKRSSNGCDGF